MLVAGIDLVGMSGGKACSPAPPSVGRSIVPTAEGAPPKGRYRSGRGQEVVLPQRVGTKPMVHPLVVCLTLRGRLGKITGGEVVGSSVFSLAALRFRLVPDHRVPGPAPKRDRDFGGRGTIQQNAIKGRADEFGLSSDAKRLFPLHWGDRLFVPSG